MNVRRRPLILALLLIVGVQAWLVVGRGILGPTGASLAAAACFVIACLPFVRPRMNRLGRRLSHPSESTRCWTAIGVTLAMAAFLYCTAVAQQRGLYPKFHDQFMYLLQARMLASGRLWMPPHVLAEFFDTFYVFVTPVYASLSWPGASLMFVPSVWLGLPPWVAPLVAASVAAGLLYSVTTQIFDGMCGLIAVVALAATPMYRVQGLSAQAQAPMLLLAVALAWAWLRWRRDPSPWRAAVVGAVAGWAAITRPVDAICVALPIFLATLPLLRRLPLRVTLSNAAAAVACAVPFIALQLVFNFGVTGSIAHAPFSYYNERDQPQVAFGFPKYDPAKRPKSHLPQKIEMYDEWYVPSIKTHTWRAAPARLASDTATTMNLLLPHRLLWVLVPPAVLAIFTWRRFAMWGALPAFLVLYSFYTLFLDHYTLFTAPAVLTIVLGGMRAVQRCWPGVRGAVAAGVLALCVGSLPQFRPHELDEIPSPSMEEVANLSKSVEAPAIVLFHFEHGAPIHEEPVYNIDTPWPDDAPIIRAHDLGPDENRELLRYYAERQPQRRVYLFNRVAANDRLRYLGTAGELSAAPPRPATVPTSR